MTDLAWTVTLTSGTVVGFLLTVGGIVAAFAGAKRQVSRAGGRIRRIEELMAEEVAATKTYWSEHTRGEGEFTSFAAEIPEIEERFEHLYSKEGLVRPTLSRIELLAPLESVRLLNIILDSSRVNLFWAGIGVLLLSAASAVSLFV
jgi:hypothetical protein